jgi:hypothetical protein
MSVLPGFPQGSGPHQQRPDAPGSQTFSTPGIYEFVVPRFNTLTVAVKGGGGAGGSVANTEPTSLPDSAWTGGVGGMSGLYIPASNDWHIWGEGGAGGVGIEEDNYPKNQDKTSANGAAGRAFLGFGGGGFLTSDGTGAAGGAGGTFLFSSPSHRRTGGIGGKGGGYTKVWQYHESLAPVRGSTVQVYVGSGGAPTVDTAVRSAGVAGSNGSVVITWS